MKNILLLTDFSDNSVNAMYYALRLFSSESCNFHVLHVELSNTYLSDDLMAGGNQSIYDSLVKKSKTKLKTLITDLKTKAQSEDFSFEMIIDHDVFVDAINQVIESRKIDLIVMGTNGITGAKEALFGSNTINVIRKVNCPTLVIPENFAYVSPKRILLPLDLRDSLSGDAFKNAIKFTRRFGEKLHVVRIKPNSEDSLEQHKDEDSLNKYANNISYEYHVVTDIPMPYVVNSFTQLYKVDMTILLVQKERLFERFFIGSPKTQISNKIRVPLLIFHA